MRSVILTVMLLVLLTLLSSCNPSLVVAQPHLGFTPTSAVVLVAPGVYYIGVEAIFGQAPPLQAHDLEFSLPVGATAVALQGTSSFRTTCSAGQYLAQVWIDGAPYPMNHKVAYGGGETHEWVDYSIPLPVVIGFARIHVDADPDCLNNARPTTWEFQGLLQIK